jgi:heat shock protein HtpX
MNLRAGQTTDRRALAAVQHLYFAAWSLLSAANGHLALGLLSCLLFGLLSVLSVRIARLPARPAGDAAAELERVRRLLTPLCERAGCVPPEVAVVGLAVGAANARVTKRRPLITVSRWLLEELPDPELAAVLAHELSHVVRGDCPRVKRRRLVVLLIPAFVAGVLYGAAGFDPFTAPLAMAGLTLGAMAGTRLLAPWHRPLEVRADADAVALTGEPEAVARALAAISRRTDEQRRRLRGGPPLAWLLAPLTTPPRTHPSLGERVAAAGAAQPPAAA